MKQAQLEFQFDVVKTLEEFAGQLGTKTFDIVLADYKLSGWVGLDAFELMKKTECNIPFVLVSV
jgi:DNA-binding NtrC family response regulator